MSPLGLYLHIPFCRAKCAYCDFNSYAGMDALFERYVHAVVAEMRCVAEERGRLHADSIYIGGGTPTVLPPALLVQLLTACRAGFDLARHAEISIEANPGTENVETLWALRTAGINRLSLGVQSFSDPELQLLGRIHNANLARQAIAQARQAGFNNLNLDLIYNLPSQSVNDWAFSLNQALQLAPEHLSLYALSVEEDTPLAGRISRGELPTPDPDVAADMYTLAEERLEQANYLHYELSNWAHQPRVVPAAVAQPTHASSHSEHAAEAQPPVAPCHSERSEESRPIVRTETSLSSRDRGGSQRMPSDNAPRQKEILHFVQDDMEEQRTAPFCRHNLKYWRRDPYLGFGAGAHSFFHGRRYNNVARPEDYVLQMERAVSSQENFEEITHEEAMAEAMILGLRLLDGVRDADFRRQYGASPRSFYSSQLVELTELGLVESTTDSLRLTAHGRLLANRVFGYFWPPPARRSS